MKKLFFLTLLFFPLHLFCAARPSCHETEQYRTLTTEKAQLLKNGLNFADFSLEQWEKSFSGLVIPESALKELSAKVTKEVMQEVTNFNEKVARKVAPEDAQNYAVSPEQLKELIADVCAYVPLAHIAQAYKREQERLIKIVARGVQKKEAPEQLAHLLARKPYVALRALPRSVLAVLMITPPAEYGHTAIDTKRKMATPASAWPEDTVCQEHFAQLPILLQKDVVALSSHDLQLALLSIFSYVRLYKTPHKIDYQTLTLSEPRYSVPFCKGERIYKYVSEHAQEVTPLKKASEPALSRDNSTMAVLSSDRGIVHVFALEKEIIDTKEKPEIVQRYVPIYKLVMPEQQYGHEFSLNGNGTVLALSGYRKEGEQWIPFIWLFNRDKNVVSRYATKDYAYAPSLDNKGELLSYLDSSSVDATKVMVSNVRKDTPYAMPECVHTITGEEHVAQSLSGDGRVLVIVSDSAVFLYVKQATSSYKAHKPFGDVMLSNYDGARSDRFPYLKSVSVNDDGSVFVVANQYETKVCVRQPNGLYRVAFTGKGSSGLVMNSNGTRFALIDASDNSLHIYRALIFDLQGYSLEQRLFLSELCHTVVKARPSMSSRFYDTHHWSDVKKIELTDQENAVFKTLNAKIRALIINCLLNKYRILLVVPLSTAEKDATSFFAKKIQAIIENWKKKIVNFNVYTPNRFALYKKLTGFFHKTDRIIRSTVITASAMKKLLIEKK